MNKEKVLKKIRSGVYVVTTNFEGKDYGLTVAWCTRVSFDPCLIVISVGKNRYSYEKIKKAKKFVVNILGEKGLEIGRHFGLTSGKNVDKFEGIEFEKSRLGNPVLEDSVGALDCELVKTVDAGDHEIFIGEVKDSVERGGESLVFRKEDFF